MTLKEIRNEKGLTQKEAAEISGVSLRSYKTYENDEKKIGSLKYNYIYEKIAAINPIDEQTGIVDADYIKEKCAIVFDKYEVDFCYLFGSYAKETAMENSDVDLLVSTKTSGLGFYGLVEELREVLRKKVDVLDIGQLKDNFDLTKEILSDGIRIYG